MLAVNVNIQDRPINDQQETLYILILFKVMFVNYM